MTKPWFGLLQAVSVTSSKTFAKIARLCELIRSLLPITPRDVGLAFFLGCSSWLVLTPLWNHAVRGGLVDRALEMLFSPSYRVGKHLGHVIFPNSETRNATGALVAPFMGVAGEVLFLTALWVIAISRIRWKRARTEKHNCKEFQQS